MAKPKIPKPLFDRIDSHVRFRLVLFEKKATALNKQIKERIELTSFEKTSTLYKGKRPSLNVN